VGKRAAEELKTDEAKGWSATFWALSQRKDKHEDVLSVNEIAKEVVEKVHLTVEVNDFVSDVGEVGENAKHALEIINKGLKLLDSGTDVEKVATDAMMAKDLESAVTTAAKTFAIFGSVLSVASLIYAWNSENPTEAEAKKVRANLK